MFIGIMGFSGVGKDTAAEALVEDFDFFRLAFADELKREVYEEIVDSPNPFHQEVKSWIDRLGWDEAKRQFAEIREYLQFYGQVKRLTDSDYWVNRLDDIVALHQIDNLVIPDVRYGNEADYVIDEGGVLIHLYSDDVCPANDHVSEIEHVSFADWAELRIDVTGMSRKQMKAEVSRQVLHSFLNPQEAA